MIPFEQVYSWLNKFGSTHLRPSSNTLISSMKNALEAGHRTDAAGLLQQLEDYACKLRDDAEGVEVLLECADTAEGLGNLDEAGTILVETVSRAWSDLHRRAVIQWLLGAVQWRSMPSRQHAVVSWRNSISDFERLAKKPSISHQQRIWYEDTCRLLEENLVEALEESGRDMDLIQPVGTTEDDLDAHSGEVFTSFLPSASMETRTFDTQMPAESTLTRTSDILQIFTISEEIPAGDFGPSGYDPFPIGVVELDQLSINGHPYSIHSTRGKKVINLSLDQQTTVVKVKGDSMNLENITQQDFVILRRVDLPSNGDIVMAEIIGVDSRATLKQYFKDEDTITLQPHSSNPDHKPFIFKKDKEGFYIRGVVIAVLKPI
jgi:hypothetical protein